MSHIPFASPDVAAATMSNLALYSTDVIISGVGTSLLFTPDPRNGQFVVLEVWFHVTDNSANDQRQFTASIGHGGGSLDNICASAVRGTTTTTAALQLRVKKAVKFDTRIASTYYVGYAVPGNPGAPGVATPVYLNVTVAPSAAISGTFFVVGYHTGMRP